MYYSSDIARKIKIKIIIPEKLMYNEYKIKSSIFYVNFAGNFLALNN